MKKVLHILNSLLPSGAESMLKVSARYWDKDIEHHILATYKNIGDYASELKKEGYVIHHIHDENQIKQHLKVFRFIKENKFDVVHVHCEGQALYYELDAVLSGKKTVVRTVHNVFKFRGLLRIRRIITRNLAVAMGVKHVAIGNSVYENEKKEYFLKCIVIDNWYDEKKYVYTDSSIKIKAREKLGVPDRCYCIVSVGNCSHVKNHMPILYAIDKMKSEGIEKNELMYFHVGKGVQEEEELQYIQKKDLKEYVRYIGFADPLIYLQAADLYIMPSVYEGLGIATLEAMATGVHCLLTDVPGLKDFKNREFKNVQYCELEDSKIIAAIEEKIRRGIIGNSQEQSAAVVNYYGIKQGINGYQNIYFS